MLDVAPSSRTLETLVSASNKPNWRQAWSISPGIDRLLTTRTGNVDLLKFKDSSYCVVELGFAVNRSASINTDLGSTFRVFHDLTPEVEQSVIILWVLTLRSKVEVHSSQATSMRCT